MTAHQRRPGFRLPWSSEEDGVLAEGEPTTAEAAAEPASASADAASEPEVATTAAAPEDATAAPEAAAPEAAAPGAAAAPPQPEAAVGEPEAAPAEPEPPEDDGSSSDTADEVEVASAEAPSAEEATTPTAASPSGDDFMRDLVAAMRGVADEAREAGMSELRAKADDQVRKLEADAEQRREDLRSRAEADVAGVGEWARSEAERIKHEAEQRVVARRAQLDQQLAADTGRTESETRAVRDRVTEYERELEAYHAQLTEINDPAAFAAAAKRLPKPPTLAGRPPQAPVPADAPSSVAADTAAGGAASNGVPGETDAHPAEVLASRLAELDATLPKKPDTVEPQAQAAPAPVEPVPASAAEASVPASAEPAQAAESPAPAPAPDPSPPAASGSTESAVTEVVVKGLGSFGAITGFRQSLSGVDGIESVALSLGQTGEFVFRATHAAGFDVRGAIVTLEGDGARVEDRQEGGLRVTLERAR